MHFHLAESHLSQAQRQWRLQQVQQPERIGLHVAVRKCQKTKSELRHSAKGQLPNRHSEEAGGGGVPRVEKERRLISTHLSVKKDKKKEWEERTSSALIRQSRLKKGLLTPFCPEKGCNFYFFPQKLYTLLQGFFWGSNTAMRCTHRHTHGCRLPPWRAGDGQGSKGQLLWVSLAQH